MKILNKISFVLIICFLNSCANFKSNAYVDGQIKLTNDNLHFINGKFHKSKPEQFNPKNGELFWAYFSTLFTKNAWGTKHDYFIDLKSIDNKHINVTFLVNDSIIKSCSAVGKLKNGYFELNKRYIFKPLIIANALGEKKIRIGLLENSNLTIDYRHSVFGNILIIPAGNIYDYKKIEYLKVNN